MAAPPSGPIGNAKGRIEVDISDLIAARDNAVKAGRVIQQALKDIGPAGEQGSREAERGLGRLEKRLDSIATKGALAMAGLVGGGLKAAQSVKEIEFLFGKLAGGPERAAKEMDNLRKMADKTGQPFLQLVKGASSLFPAIRRSNAELSQTVSIAQRLSILDPAQGIEGAGIAIREFLSGEYMSLVRRFEMDRGRLQQIRNEADGNVQAMVQGLDDYISEMGLSQAAMEEMGEVGIGAFAAMRDEAVLAAAEAFTPLLNDFILPAVRGFRDLVREIREVNPELLKAGAAVATLVAGMGMAKKGIPMLGIGGIPGADRFSQTRTVGRGLSIYGGIHAGVAASRFLSEQGIGDPELKNRSQEGAMNLLGERIKQVIGIMVSGLANMAKVVALVNSGLKLFWEVLTGILDKIDGALEVWMGKLMNFIDDIPGISAPRKSEEELRWARNRRDAPIISQERRSEIGQDLVDDFENIDRNTKGLFESLGLIDRIDVSFGSFLDRAKAGIDGMFQQEPPDFSQEQIDAFVEFQERLAEIEKSAQEERESALEQHEKAKTELQDDYDRRLKRMQEDEDRRRARAVQDRDRDISDALARSADKESEIYESHRDKLADLESKYLGETEKNQVDHQRKMSRMQRDHDEAIRKAAADLDFQAIWEMRQRQQTQQQDEESDFEYRQAQRKAQYDEALAAEQVALAERLAANEEAERSRIEQIKQSFVEQEALRAENRQLELSRMAEDHALQLAKMDEQHLERLQQIDDQAKERAAMENQAFVDLFNELAVAAGQHQDRMLGIQRQGQAQAEAELRAWWNRQGGLFNKGSRGVTAGPSGDGRMGGYQGFAPIEQVANVGRNDLNHNPGNRSRYIGTTLGSRAVGGEIRATGPYQLEAGEGVLRRDLWSQAKRMMGGGELTQHGAMAAMAGGRGGGPVSFGDINVDIGDVGNYSPDDIAKLVERGVETGVLKIFKGYAAG